MKQNLADIWKILADIWRNLVILAAIERIWDALVELGMNFWVISGQNREMCPLSRVTKTSPTLNASQSDRVNQSMHALSNPILPPPSPPPLRHTQYTTQP